MFDFDVSKLLLVALLALIVLGPEKLPKAARMAGVVLRRVRVGWDSVRSEVEQGLQLDELRAAATRARTEMRSLDAAAHRELRAAQDAIDSTATDVAAAVTAENDKAVAPGPQLARPGCTPKDIDQIAVRSRAEMESIRRIADQQIAAARARAAQDRAAKAAATAKGAVPGSVSDGRTD